jgi:hypothetical protein
MCAKLLRRKTASDYLLNVHGISRAPATLAKLAVIGGGPTFQRDGRFPLYSPQNLDAYAASVLSAPMRSTSDIERTPKPSAPISIIHQQRGGAAE